MKGRFRTLCVERSQSPNDPFAEITLERYIPFMTLIDAKLLAQFPLDDITRVTFYKRDEMTFDLICCDVEKGKSVWTFHEELVGWNSLIEHLQLLPGFRADWFGAVSQPPFVTNETLAFER